MVKRSSSELNEQQHAAVTAGDGPLLVLAGAGSGKTRVIVHRVAHLVEARGVSPDEILAVTFTNKAAEEMRERVARLVAQDAGKIAVHTFHALCLRLLRRFGEDIGLGAGFTVYGNDDRKALLRRVCRDEGLIEREFPIARMGAAVAAYKLRAFEGSVPAPSGPQQRVVEQVAQRYQNELDAQSAVDFDDLLIRAVELLECSERAQQFAARRFRHVLVDEYQDTNRIQYRLVRLLAPHGNVFVVGDEDQSIYNFRGADMRNILDFESDFPEARTIKLEVNYRSSGAILRAADAVIRNNQARKAKRLIAHREEGEPPQLYGADDEHDEARYVARTLESLRRDDPEADAAVLLRTHAQTRVFEEELVARGIPHKVLGGQRFYDRKEIRDALAYARLLANRHDDASFQRVVNVPLRGVGQASVAMLLDGAQRHSSSLWDASEEALSSDALPGRARVGVTAFRDLVTKLSTDAADRSPSEVLEMILSRTGLVADLAREGEAAARERKENLDQLVAAAAEYEAREEASLEGFLDGISLVSDLDTAGQTPCLLMTLHAAKGLEFDTVFLAGLEEGLFPHIRASGDPKSLEEERRLFYVGMTRAQRRLHLSYSMSRRFSYQASSRRASRFLDEIPEAAFVGERRENPAASGAASSALRPGIFVSHAKFGEGKIVDASGSGADRRVTVQFRNAGRKRLVAKFAKLEVVG